MLNDLKALYPVIFMDKCWTKSQNITGFFSPCRAAVLALHSHWLDSLLEKASPIHHHDGMRIAQVPHYVILRVIPDFFGTPLVSDQ